MRTRYTPAGHMPLLRFICIFTLMLGIFPAFLPAQAPPIQWAYRFGGGATQYENGEDIYVDAAGNVYVTGYFEGTVDFDPSAAIASRVSNGLHDIFVVKFDAAGVYQWVLTMGGAGYDQGKGVAVDAAGNVYITGYFANTVDFNPSAATNNLTASADDAFVAKYNSFGVYQWAFRLGSTGYELATDIDVDAAGANVYVTGHFFGTVDFNPSATTNNLISAGSMDMFLAKYSTAGAYQWAFRVGAGSFNDEEGRSVSCVGNTDIVVTGVYSGACDFDPGAGTATRTPLGGLDGFTASYTAAGAFSWANTFGSADSDEPMAVDTDPLGNVYVAGGFSQTCDFDPTAGVQNRTSAGVFDICLIKYTPAGALEWVNQIGGINNEIFYGLAVDIDGNAYVTGYVRGITVDMDPGAGVANVAGVGSFDIVLASYTTTGAYRWAWLAGSTDLEIGYEVGVNGCHLAFTGYFNQTEDFDPSAGVYNLTASGGFDAFIAKYNNCGILPAGEVHALLRQESGRNLLQWRAEVPVGGGMFAVERAGADGNFEVMGELEAQEGAGEWTWTDAAPLPGRTYYRIHLHSPDGLSLYSETLMAMPDGSAGDLLVYPQPAGDHVQVQVRLAESGPVQIQLWDAAGRRVYAAEADGAAGTQVFPLPLTGLAAGMYQLHITHTSGNRRLPLVIQ